MIADSTVKLAEGSRVTVRFPCPSCGTRICGNYCHNCGAKTTALSRMNFISVDLMVAAGILAEALDAIVEDIHRKALKEGASEEEIVERIKERFDVPEKFKAREAR